MHDPSIKRVADLFGVEALSVTQAAGGFSGASVFRVVTSDPRVFALRRTSIAASLPEQRLRALHRLLSLVQEQGMTVIPVPLRPCRSALLREGLSQDLGIGESWIRSGGDLWQLEPWMPGGAADEALTDAQVRAALDCLQEFHYRAQAAVAAMSPNEWFFVGSGRSPAAERRLMLAKELAVGGLANLKSAAESDADIRFRSHALRICQAVAEWLPWLVTRLTQSCHFSFSLQPVVRDLWRAHVLFTGDEVTGLIDFSAAASDHVALDPARLLRSWFRSDIQRIRDAAERFSAQRSLSVMEWTLLEAFDAATVLLSPVTWLRRRYESGDQAQCREDVLARLTELTEIAERFRPLLSRG